MSDFFSELLHDATLVFAAVETDVGSVVNHYAVVKGLGQVALTAVSALDPAAATVINGGIALVDGWINAGAEAVNANAPKIITTTQDILAAAAPMISAVTNAATTVAEPLT